jgi:hypothetical protein
MHKFVLGVYLILHIHGVSHAFPNYGCNKNSDVLGSDACPEANMLLCSSQTRFIALLKRPRFSRGPSPDDCFGAPSHPLVLRGGAQRESRTQSTYDQGQDDELSKALELLDKVRSL